MAKDPRPDPPAPKSWVGIAIAATICCLLVVESGCGSRRTLVSPGCSTAVAPSRPFTGVPTTMVKLPASPFGVASAAGLSFVTVGGYTGLNELWVYRGGLHPRLVRRLALPVPGAAGEAVTPDGRLLLVAAGSGLTVVDVRKAHSGAPHAILGSLQALAANAETGALDPRSAIEVAVTPDGRFAFVSLEYLGKIAVFDLWAARAAGWKRSGFRGMISVGLVDVGLSVSPDGRTLYATRAVSHPANGASELGTLDVIDVRLAETRPSVAVVHRVAAGCDPVRVAASHDGKMVWVTARGSDALLGFSASRLSHNPEEALEKDIQVGEAPVGFALLDGGRIVILNSNRFGVIGAASTLSLVDGNRGTTVGTLRAGAFPREAAVTSDGRTLLVTNWSSQQLEAVALSTLP